MLSATTHTKEMGACIFRKGQIMQRVGREREKRTGIEKDKEKII